MTKWADLRLQRACGLIHEVLTEHGDLEACQRLQDVLDVVEEADVAIEKRRVSPGASV